MLGIAPPKYFFHFSMILTEGPASPGGPGSPGKPTGP